MSDPTGIEISGLTAVTSVDDADDLVIVAGGNTRRADASLLRSIAFVIGEYRYIGGNVRAFSTSFPNMCLTNFDLSISINDTNWPDYVPWLRSQQNIYLEGKTGQTNSFSGTIAASVITLDNNTANNAILAILEQDQLAFGTFSNWRTVDIDGTTYDITALDVTARTITVSGAPTTGVQSAAFYPHRVAGSTTTARLHSMSGYTMRGTGTSELVSGFFRRDRLQGHRHFVTNGSNVESSLINYGNTVGAGGVNIARSNVASGTQFEIRDPNTDGINGTPRTGSDTHGPDVGVHIYQYGGRYIP